VTTLYVSGLATGSALASVWTTWWLGDAAGAMLVAPPVLLWHATPRPQWSRQQRREIAALLLATVLVPWLLFVRLEYPLPFLFLCLPVCVWAGLRFGQREASTSACVLTAMAAWGTFRGHGTLVNASLNTRLLLLQLFMGTTSLMGLVVGAVVWEAKRAAGDVRRLNDELEQRVAARTAELQAAYDQMNQAQQLAQVGSWHWTAADKRVWWSEELYRICGVDPVSFSPSIVGLLHPDDRDMVLTAVQRALEDRQPFDIEDRIIRPNGQVRTLHSLGRVVVDGSGQVVRLMGTSQDVTDHKAADEVVTRSERRLQTIIDAEPACVTVVSRDGTLLDMNRAGLEMVGVDDLAQVVGRSVTNLVHADHLHQYLAMHRAASNGSPGRLEFRLLGFNGEDRWVDSRAVPFDASMQAAGAERAVLSVASDVTERKRLEGRLREAHQMEAVGRLAGGVAHDFNNLLTAISGFTELVLHTVDEADPRRADLIEVRKAAIRAASLTRQLLAFGRRQILQPKVLDLNALVSDIEKLLHRTLGEDIEIVLNFDPALEPVRADPSQLEQVVINIAVNARDAMPKGGRLRFMTGMVDVDTAAAQRRGPMPPGRYVRLIIADTGTGMSSEIKRHIFEPFFTTKERNKGTGLGLATVYGIVKQSGGYIWVTSQPGLGTSFEIDLPAIEGTVEALVRAEQPAAVTGGTETVLLAEDDGAVRRLASIALRQYGYTVLEARDGEEALQMARSDRRRDIHLLIADVVMPGLSGRDLALQLGTERPAIKVLYTSGYAEAITIRAGLTRGEPLLAKPFVSCDLVQRVRETLDSPPIPA
jgi:PAS domain S-box-containing protein